MARNHGAPRSYHESDSSRFAAWMLPAHGEGTLRITSAVFEQYCEAARDIPDPEILAGLAIGEADWTIPRGRVVTADSLARAIARLPEMRLSLKRELGDFPLLPGGHEARPGLSPEHARKTILRFLAAAGMSIDADGLDLMASPRMEFEDEGGTPAPVLFTNSLTWLLAWVAHGGLDTGAITRVEVATAKYVLDNDASRAHRIDVTPPPDEPEFVEPKQPESEYVSTALVQVAAAYEGDPRVAVVLRMLPWERVTGIVSRRDGNGVSGIDALCAAIASTEFPEILAGSVAGGLYSWGGATWLTSESSETAVDGLPYWLSYFPSNPPMGIMPAGYARDSRVSPIEAYLTAMLDPTASPGGTVPVSDLLDRSQRAMEAAIASAAEARDAPAPPALPDTLTPLLPSGTGLDTELTDRDGLDILARFMGASGWGYEEAWNPILLPVLIKSQTGWNGEGRPWTARRLADLCSAVSAFGHEYHALRHGDPASVAPLILAEMHRTGIIPTTQRMNGSTRVAVTLLPLQSLGRLSPGAAARFCELAGLTDRPEVLAGCAVREIANLPADSDITLATIEAAAERMSRITPDLPPLSGPVSPLVPWSWSGQRGLLTRLAPDAVHEALSSFFLAAGEDPGTVPRPGTFKEVAPADRGWTIQTVAQFGSELARSIAESAVPNRGRMVSLLNTFVEALGTNGRHL